MKHHSFCMVSRFLFNRGGNFHQATSTGAGLPCLLFAVKRENCLMNAHFPWNRLFWSCKISCPAVYSWWEAMLEKRSILHIIKFIKSSHSIIHLDRDSYFLHTFADRQTAVKADSPTGPVWNLIARGPCQPAMHKFQGLLRHLNSTESPVSLGRQSRGKELTELTADYGQTMCRSRRLPEIPRSLSRRSAPTLLLLLKTSPELDNSFFNSILFA